MRIRFLSEQIYETGGVGKGPKFAQGFVLDQSDVGKVLGVPDANEAFAEAFLNRWVQRGAAEYVDGRAKPSEPEVPIEPAPVSEPAPVVEKAPPKPVDSSVVSQPLGTARRGRPSIGNDKG